MPHDARERHEVHTELAERVGPRAAGFLMERLPPVPWDELATTKDLAGLEERIGLRMETLEQRLTAAFRGELGSAITHQTRSIIFANIGTVVATAAAVISAARLA